MNSVILINGLKASCIDLIDSSGVNLGFLYIQDKTLKKYFRFLIRNSSSMGQVPTEQGNTVLKVHKHEIFFLTFFAETETIWSQGPVTRDF